MVLAAVTFVKRPDRILWHVNHIPPVLRLWPQLRDSKSPIIATSTRKLRARGRSPTPTSDRQFHQVTPILPDRIVAPPIPKVGTLATIITRGLTAVETSLCGPKRDYAAHGQVVEHYVSKNKGEQRTLCLTPPCAA